MRHPMWAILRRFEAGTLSGPHRARVAGHLLSCGRCRQEIERIRATKTSLKEALSPPPTPAVFTRVLARRASGERVLLTTSSEHVQNRISRSAVAAAIVVFMATATFALGTRDAEAIASELAFMPAQPSPGDTVRVEYRSGSLFEGEDTLRLRVRYRSSRGVSYNRGPVFSTTGRLVRDTDGHFRGAFQLPDSVVYATFAVEDLTGHTIDHNGQRLWELLVQEGGRPSFSALEQKIFDLHGRNWELMYRTAQEMTQLYPDHPRAWSYLRSLERDILSPSARDSLDKIHAERARRFHLSLFGKDRLPVDVVHGLYSYAPDRESLRYWKRHGSREFPLSGWGAFMREDIVFDLHRDDPATFLREIEKIWKDIEPVVGADHAIWFKNGVSAAREADDPRAFLRWTERTLRYDDLSPRMVAYYLGGLIEWPELRDEGIRRMRAEIRRLSRPRDVERSLTTTREAQRRLDAEAVAALRAKLAVALLAQGDTGAALREYEHASRVLWDGRIFRALGELELTRGDTSAAQAYFARVLVDSATSGGFADTARILVGTGSIRPWPVALEEARTEMVSRILDGAMPRRIKRDVEIIDEDGNARLLAEVAGSRLTLVAYWSRTCGPSRKQLPELERLSRELQAQGVTVIALAEGTPTELQAFLRDQRIELPVFSDEGEVAKAFSKWSTPTYYVLDEHGQVWFEGHDLQAVSRQFAALRARVVN